MYGNYHWNEWIALEFCPKVVGYSKDFSRYEFYVPYSYSLFSVSILLVFIVIVSINRNQIYITFNFDSQATGNLGGKALQPVW